MKNKIVLQCRFLLLTFLVQKTMTTRANRNDMQPMFRIVAKMMVIMCGWFAASYTFACFDCGKVASANGKLNRLLRFSPFCVFRFPSFCPFFASRTKPIGIFLFKSLPRSTAAFVSALLATPFSAIATSFVFLELGQCLRLTALSASFAFHKNASCQLGVSAFA